MKNRLLCLSVVFLFLAFFGITSCKQSPEILNVENQTQTGSISGTVMYSNVTGKNHAGITVSIEKTDGLRTLAVEKAASGRSLSACARSIISNTVTTKDGSYTFKNLEPGTYTVYAASTCSMERAVYTNVSVRASETSVVDVLKLTATGSITGRITTNGKTSGNTGYIVFVAGTSYIAMTDNAGNYTISGVPAGKYQVVATKDGVTQILNSSVKVSPDTATTIYSYDFSVSQSGSSSSGSSVSIVWKGELSSAPSYPSTNWAYYNTETGCSYIWNGYMWDLLAKAGANGSSSSGDSVSIVWKGELLSAPSSPSVNWAYYNTETGCSYIWNGYMWNLLAKAGANGSSSSGDSVSIVWKGELSSAPSYPSTNWAYYNTETGCSYIWNGYMWNLLAKAGANGSSSSGSSVSLVWKGELNYVPDNPGLYWAFFYTVDGCSYIWNGIKWDTLARAGANGAGIEAPLAITTVLSTYERTTNPVIITVNSTKKDLLRIGYVYSSEIKVWETFKSIFNDSDFVPISSDSSGKYTFAAGYNGYYTVVAQDKAGDVTVCQEIVSNLNITDSFGSYPQTIKAADVVIDENITKTAGVFTYYKGSDGEWYAKLAENAYYSIFTYSDGTTVRQNGTSYRYFKVEPIKWRVLTGNYSGKKLLLAENILIGKRFDDNSNNYRNSEIRSWLNGDFLQTAFTEEERALIAYTTVNNSARSTNPDADATLWNSGNNQYACENTTDKIFLLSEQEVTTESYGFDEDPYAYAGDGTHTESTRIRVTTDFAMASGAFCSWWLRSPYYNDRGSRARRVYSNGNADYDNDVWDANGGVVPALCIE